MSHKRKFSVPRRFYYRVCLFLQIVWRPGDHQFTQWRHRICIADAWSIASNVWPRKAWDWRQQHESKA